jgi:3,4-dihydroxy 2-butanone 4-phosphate synthase/GTP cyclohydrolase II
VILDDVNDCAYLSIAAGFTTAAHVNFMTSKARGLISVALTERRAEALGLALSGEYAGDRCSAFRVSVEARTGVATGISAPDRARTIQALASAASTPGDLVRPGHAFPALTHARGVLGSPAIAEAGVELARRAGLTEAAVVCAILRDDGKFASGGTTVGRFARRHDFPIVSVRDLVRLRLSSEQLVRSVSTGCEEGSGPVQAIAFRSRDSNAAYVALFCETQRNKKPVIYLQRRCNAYGVHDRCTCSRDSAAALVRLLENGGVIIHLPDTHLDHLPGPSDAAQAANPSGTRRPPGEYYAVSVQIARDLGVGSTRSAMAESVDIRGLQWYGLNVTAVPERRSPADVQGVAGTRARLEGRYRARAGLVPQLAGEPV